MWRNEPYNIIIYMYPGPFQKERGPGVYTLFAHASNFPCESHCISISIHMGHVWSTKTVLPDTTANHCIIHRSKVSSFVIVYNLDRLRKRNVEKWAKITRFPVHASLLGKQSMHKQCVPGPHSFWEGPG